MKTLDPSSNIATLEKKGINQLLDGAKKTSEEMQKRRHWSIRINLPLLPKTRLPCILKNMRMVNI